MAIDPVVIKFATAGLADVGRAFDTIEARIKRFEKSAQQESERGSRSRVRDTQDEVKAKERAYTKLDADVKRMARQQERDAARAEKEKTKAAKQAADETVRVARRAAAEEKREADRLAEYKHRLMLRSAEQASRIAAQEVAEERRIRERALRERGAVGRRIGGIASSSVGRLVGGAGSLAGATLGIGGGFMIADAARQEMDAQRTAALLVNAVTTGAAPPPGANVASILGQAGALSKTLGVDKNTLLQGTLEYSRKARGGDFAGAMANMGFFAKMSQVTGTDISEIAGAAGTLQSQNQNLKAPEMQQMLLDVYAQGKAGSLSMVDVAKQLGIMSSARGAFSGDVATNQRKLLALGQLAAPEGNPEEAGTFIKDLVMEAGKHRKSTQGKPGLEAMGVKYDRFGRMESPEQMIEAVFRGTGGDVTKITDIFGARGKALFGALLNPYTAAGGGEAGISAVRKTMASVTGATMTTSQLEAQHQQIMDTPAQKFAVAINKVREALEEKLEPRLSHFADDTLPKLIPKFEAIIDSASEFASWFADNPIKGVGAIVLAAISKDLAMAGIGQVVKDIIAKLMMGAMPIPTPGGVGGSTAGKLLPVVAAGIGAAALTVAAIDSDISAREGSQRATAMGTTQSVLDAAGLARKAKAGTVTAADVARAHASVASLSAQAASKKAAIGTNDMGFLQTAAMQLVNPSGAKEMAQATYNEQVRAYQQTKQALDAMTKAAHMAEVALRAHGETAANTGPNNPARNVPINQRPTP